MHFRNVYHLTDEEASIAFEAIASRRVIARCECDTDVGFRCDRCENLINRGGDVEQYERDLAHRYGQHLKARRLLTLPKKQTHELQPGYMRGKVKITGTVCGEYWGLTGIVGPERCTKGLRRNHRDGVIEEIETEPTCVIVFDDNDDYRERCRARGAVGLAVSLSLPVSDIQFEVDSCPQQSRPLTTSES